MNRRSFFKTMLGVAGVAATGGTSVARGSSMPPLMGCATGGVVAPSKPIGLIGECGPDAIISIKQYIDSNRAEFDHAVISAIHDGIRRRTISLKA